MTDREPNDGQVRAGVLPAEVLAQYRERVVRRRRSAKHRHAGNWVARRSFRRLVRTVAVCTGILLLMALGVYASLARQDSAGGGGEGSSNPRLARLVPRG